LNLMCGIAGTVLQLIAPTLQLGSDALAMLLALRP